LSKGFILIKKYWHLKSFSYRNKLSERNKNDSSEKIAERAQLLTKIYISFHFFIFFEKTFFLIYRNVRDVKRVFDFLYTSIDCSDKTKETILSLMKVQPF